VLLAAAMAWSIRLIWMLIAQRPVSPWHRCMALALAILGTIPFCMAWVLFFLVW
jgi:hypothetical protein